VESATTELARLPGLETAEVAPQMKPAHWLERGPSKRLMVFAGSSHPELAQRIAELLGVELGEVELEVFANGETYCRYGESIRGADVFLVQTGCQPIDRHLMELLFMIQAAKLASAKRITAVIPLFLHAGQIQGFFTIPVDHMTALPLFAQHFRDLGLTGENIVSVSPDAGRAKTAIRFSEMIEATWAIMNKTRPSRDVVEVTEVTGRVDGKIAILGDDVIMTGGTLLANVEALRQKGATDVYVFATHGLFCDGALDRFADADVARIVVTDTVPIDPLRRPPNMTVLPVSGLLAETITNVFSDDSVSAIFGGENQLF